MILVTGGAGFIGSVLVKMLNDKGHDEILIVDRLRDQDKWINLRGLNYTDYIHADELFDEKNEAILNRVSSIYHMGACSSTTEKNMDYLMMNNFEYTKKLFIFASYKDIKICFASSAATYGDGKKGYNDSHNEVGDLRPLNPYGYSKQVFDEWVIKHKRTPSFWYGVKFFNVFGPNEYHKESMRSMVCKAFEQIKKSGKVKLFKSYKDGISDGEQKRDFIYVKDACNAMIELMTSECESGLYNLGTGNAHSFNELVQACFKALNTDSKIEYIEMPNDLKGQYQYYTQANMEKFLKALPHFKFKPLGESVSDYINEYLNTANPYISK